MDSRSAVRSAVKSAGRINAARVRYRVRQFWQAICAAPTAEDLQQARELLAHPLMDLFTRMQPSEQAHSLRLYHQLRAQAESDPDLLVAALLHDAGKSRHPLRVWERVAIVLLSALSSKLVAQWGQGAADGWRRPFVVATQHPNWGAEMAAQAGASPLAVALIRRHQERLPGPDRSVEDRLLAKLQLFDDHN